MALPKEPRQKMINIMYLVLTAILALNVSAEILNAFKVVDSSLGKSNAAIDASNKTLFESLQAKMEDPANKEKATFWNDKATQAKKMADNLYQKIETYKDSLKRASGYNPEKNLLTYKEDDLDAATRLFIVNGKGPELLKDLQTFKDGMLNIDPAIKKEFSSKIPIDLSVPPSTTGGGVNSWEYNYFHMTPTVAALTILSKFENDIKNAENQVITYCQNQVGAVVFKLNKFEPIASANSTYLMPGQEMIIQAGVGAFNDQSKPTISIGGTPITLNDKGVAEKKFNVSGGGNQKVNVNIKYTNPNTGAIETLNKEIEYTVGTPGGVAASADKMNVFYIGVDNPVTVGSPTGWDKTKVGISGTATLSGANGKFIAKGVSIGKAILSVTADNKTTQFEFRVKRIPDPVFKIGPSSGGAIQAAVFKAQQFCRADLENFDFDARFQVVGGTVYFTGAGFPVPQSVTLTGNNLGGIAQMQKCGPGSSVIFDQVQVVGPDGTKRTIQAPGFLLR
ncbi:MAG: gliding motility protein GldM [Bacteroidota bacterium]